jgi:hypothetical protein
MMPKLEFKYPRTMHLHGSKLAKDDKMLGREETDDLLARDDVEFVWESKLDGTNVGIWFEGSDVFFQNRNHVLGTGEHPQYGPFRAWAYTFMSELSDVLGDRRVMFGEWCYAVHTVEYRRLPHYFHEFDVYDAASGKFLDTPSRRALLSPLVDLGIICQVPVMKAGRMTLGEARKLAYAHAVYGEDKAEGLYLKVEKGGEVVGRYKLVRDEFIQALVESDHWRHKPVKVQGLAPGVNIFNPGATR